MKNSIFGQKYPRTWLKNNKKYVIWPKKYRTFDQKQKNIDQNDQKLSCFDNKKNILAKKYHAHTKNGTTKKYWPENINYILILGGIIIWDVIYSDDRRIKC